MSEERDRRILRKTLLLCHESANATTPESQRAAEAAARLIKKLQPGSWRWRQDVRVVMLPYIDYKAGVSTGAQSGKLREPLHVKTERIIEWRLLKKGRFGVLSGDTLYILPADEAEPLW